MPIKLGEKKFDTFKKAAAYILKTKPGIRNPNAYIASIERKQHPKAK